MARASRALVASLALALPACGAGPASGERVFASPAALSEVLAVRGAADAARECKLTIRDEGGQPIAYALLRFEWPELGRVALQTDGSGSLTMRFDELKEIRGCTLTAESKPIGQDLLAAPYDECTEPIPNARIVLEIADVQ